MPIGAGGGHTDGPGIGGGAGSGSTTDNNTGNNDSGKTDPVNPTNPGGSSNTGNKDNGKQDTPTDIYGNPVDPKNPNLPKKDMPPLNPLLNHLDPLPLPPLRPEEPESPQQPEEKKPCRDNAANEANPLLEMEISTDNTSWKSNTWGYVRNRGTKFHDGLDLIGEPGVTPVYAMYSGKVIRVVSQQPNKINEKEYPSGYTGDDNDAGNRVTIETQLPNGRTIRVSYWHLDIAANNPYTQTLKYGSFVEQGQIIGIVGKTGNAIGGLPHLHIKTYIVGTDAKKDPINNPFNYLYTKFSPESGKTTRDC